MGPYSCELPKSERWYGRRLMYTIPHLNRINGRVQATPEEFRALGLGSSRFKASMKAVPSFFSLETLDRKP